MNISSLVINLFSGSTITDNGSTNKTRKNELILQPHVRYALENGDSLLCGEVAMQFFRKEEKENFLIPETPCTSRRARMEAETQISEDDVSALLNMETQPGVVANNNEEEVAPDLLDMETQAVDESVDNASEILSSETQDIAISPKNATEMLSMETQAVISSDDDATEMLALETQAVISPDDGAAEMLALETQPIDKSPSKASDILQFETQAVDETLLDGEASNKTKGSQKMDIDESIFNQATQLSIANENDNESNASKDLLTEDLVGGDNDDGNETDSSLDLIPSSQEETQMIRPFWAKQPSLSTVQEEPIASTSNIVDKAVSNPEMEQVKKKEEEESNHEEETELNDSFDLLATTQSLVGSGDEGNNNDNEEEEEEDEHKGTVPEGIVLRERNDLENEKREASETESNDDYFVEADEDRLDFDLDEDLEETDNKKPTGHKNSDTAPIPTKDTKCEEETVKELETARVIAEPSNPIVKEPETEENSTNADGPPTSKELLPTKPILIKAGQTTKEGHETTAESTSLVQGIANSTSKIEDKISDEKMVQRSKKDRKTAPKKSKRISAKKEEEERGTNLREETEAPLENINPSSNTPPKADPNQKEQKSQPKRGSRTESKNVRKSAGVTSKTSPTEESLNRKEIVPKTADADQKDKKNKPQKGQKTQSPTKEPLKKKSQVKIIRLTKEPAKEDTEDQPSPVLRRSSRTKRPSTRLSDVSPSPKKSARLSIKNTRKTASVKKPEEAVTKKCSVRVSDIGENAQETSRNERKNVRKSSVTKSKSHPAEENLDIDENAPGTSADVTISTAKPSAKIVPMTMTASRRKTATHMKPVIMFTGYQNQTDLKLVKDLGGTVTEKVANCTVLVAEELRRTTKLLCALGRGIPIVSPHWLKQSKITKTFLDPWTYILSDIDAERKWNFILKSSLKKASNNRLLDGYKVYATSNTLPKPQEIRGMS